MLCGPPHPSQRRLGPWHSAPGLTSAGLAWWPPRWRAPPLSSCRSRESFSQCGGVGVRGGHLPGVQAGPVRQYIPGSGRRRRRRGEASSGSSPAPRSLAVLEGPWRSQRDIIRTNSAAGAGRKQQSGRRTLTPHLPQIDASLARLWPPPPTGAGPQCPSGMVFCFFGLAHHVARRILVP